MAKIPKTQREWLVEHWIPRVRELPKRRQPLRTLIVGTMAISLTLCFAIVLFNIINSGSFEWGKQSVVAFLALGYSSICIKYLATMQACDDGLLSIEIAVVSGDWDKLYKAIESITCYSQMKGILKDVRKLTTE